MGVSDSGPDPFRGSLTVLCSTPACGPAFTLLRHLHSAGALVFGRPIAAAGERPAPMPCFEVDHIEPFSDWMRVLAPAGRGLLPVAPSRQ
jgi:hypothetical protein